MPSTWTRRRGVGTRLLLAVFGISAALCGAITGLIVALEAILSRILGPPAALMPPSARDLQ